MLSLFIRAYNISHLSSIPPFIVNTWAVQYFLFVVFIYTKSRISISSLLSWDRSGKMYLVPIGGRKNMHQKEKK